jgi:trehalose/maltose hydrolase-like predicted phosphorylase
VIARGDLLARGFTIEFYKANVAAKLSEYADRKVPIDVMIGRGRTRQSQVVKQADVVALIALLPDEFPSAAAKANFRYYEPRCAHGSSLSAGSPRAGCCTARRD